MPWLGAIISISIPISPIFCRVFVMSGENGIRMLA
jgi:hypothetical protein